MWYIQMNIRFVKQDEVWKKKKKKKKSLPTSCDNDKYTAGIDKGKIGRASCRERV